mmetsp:Transcript_7563/g.14095  ORF Transcript_7563/g.14095 Transcript_7563/m.14095 type:complete len:213 (-) Transcript_7563:89-727(-)
MCASPLPPPSPAAPYPPRLLKVVSESLNKCIDDWEKASSAGSDAANDLVNAKVALQYARPEVYGKASEGGELQREEFEADLCARARKTVERVQTYLEQLFLAYENLRKVSAIVAKAADMTPRKTKDRPIKSTQISIDSIEEWLHEILSMFRKSLMLKNVTFDDIAVPKEGSRETYALYLSAWVMEPYIETDRISYIKGSMEAALKVDGEIKK